MPRAAAAECIAALCICRGGGLTCVTPSPHSKTPRCAKFRSVVYARELLRGNPKRCPAAGLQTLRRSGSIDTTDSAPEAADGFVDFDFEAAFIGEFAEVEVGLEADSIADRGVKFLDEAEERVFALEM